MNTRPESLDELLLRGDAAPQPWLVDLTRLDQASACLGSAALAAVDAAPPAAALRVAGLDQAGFAALVQRLDARFTAIHLCKCPRVEDLSPLEAMPQLTLVACQWNQRATRLWDFRRTPELNGLALEDCSRLQDLAGLQVAASLRELRLGNSVWPTAVIASLEPLGALTGLLHLSFAAKRIGDGRIQPLARLTGLRTLDFPPGQFTREQIAWLRARLPGTVQGRSLGALAHLDTAFAASGATRSGVLPVGKRQRLLDATRDAVRIARRVAEFAALVEGFRADPERVPG